MLKKEEILEFASFRYQERIDRLVNVLESLFNINELHFVRYHIKFGSICLANSYNFQVPYYQKYFKVDYEYFLYNAIGSEIYISGRNAQNREQQRVIDAYEQCYHRPNGVVLIEYFDEYVDVFHFASTKFENDRINPILQQLSALKKFRHFFRREMDDLIKDPASFYLETEIKHIVQTLQQAMQNGFATKLQDADLRNSLVKKFIQEELLLNIQLTPTERRVVSWAAQGKSSKEIATKLFVSPRTVEKHTAAFREKLKCTKTNEAIHKARQIGLISSDNNVFNQPCLIRHCKDQLRRNYRT
jgi:DNA-binding CsgD family transcriptional regulator